LNLQLRLLADGYLSVGDYGAVLGCRKAVEDIMAIDWIGVYWKRAASIFVASIYRNCYAVRMSLLEEIRFRLGSAFKAHELHETIRELRRRDVLFDPSELVWIFSSGRSGTTWLKNILRDCGIATWEEPMIGEVLGFVEEKGRRLASSPNWIASDAHRPAFLAGVRAMVLHSAASRFDRLVIVKEPNGSEGAPMLSAALPESRVVCVVRDPRDVIASSFDGKRAGSWQAMRHPQAYWVRENSADSDPLEFTRLIAGHAMTNMSGAVAAYERHAGPRCLLTYEALRRLMCNSEKQ